MKTICVIVASYCLVAWNDAQAVTAADGYYQLTPNIIASATIRGDELFGELVTHLPPSNLVDGPKSVAVKIYGSCSLRQYTKHGTALFSDPWRNGYIMANTGPDNLRRKVVPKSPIAALFDRECGK